MVRCGSFDVSVTSKGQPLNAYEQMAHYTETRSLNYIEAKPGAKFEIQLTVMPSCDFGDCNSLTFDIYMDGKYLLGRTAPRSACDGGEAATDTVKGLKSQGQDGQWMLHPFKFGNMDKGMLFASFGNLMLIFAVAGNGGLSQNELDEKYSDMGSIKIVVSRYIRLGESKLSESYSKLESETVPEKGVKKSAANLTTRFDSQCRSHAPL